MEKSSFTYESPIKTTTTESSSVSVVQKSSYMKTIALPNSVNYCHINSLLRELELHNQNEGAELLKLKNAIRLNSEEVASQYKKIVELQSTIYELYVKLEDRDDRIDGLNVEVTRLTRLLAGKTKEYDDLKVTYDALVREANSGLATISQLNLTISGLQNENGRLTVRLKEIDEWRIKSGTFESALAAKSADYEKKITCLKNEIEKINEKYNKRNQEYEQLNLKYEESVRKVSEFETKSNNNLSEVERFKGLLESKKQEYDNLIIILIDKEKTIEGLNGQLVKIDKEQKSTIFSLTKELELKKGEVDRLNQEITQRSAAEAELKIRIESYLKDITSLREHLSRKDQEINQLKVDFEAKIALLNSEYSKLQNILNIKLRDIEALNGELKIKVVLIQELEEKNRFLQSENEKWKLNYQSKVAEIEQWKLKYSSLEVSDQEKQATIEELTFNVEKLRTQLNKANEELLISQRKITELTVQINDLNGRVLELEGKVALLASENLRISKLLSQKSYELDAAKNEIAVKLLIIAEMEEKLRGLAVELDRISALLVTKRSELDEWKARCGSLENRLHDLEISIQTHKEDNEKFKRAGQKNNDSIAGNMKKIAELNALIHELNLKLEDRDGKINILSQENERINKILVLKSKEFDDSKLNYERKLGENDELQSLINNLNLKIQTLTNDNNKLNGKMKEVEEWKVKYSQLEQEFGSRGSDADAKINASKLELEKVLDKYNKKVKEFDALRIRFEEYERLNGELEHKISNLNVEIDRTNGQLNLKKKEVDDLKTLLGQKEEIIASLQIQLERFSTELKNRELEFNKELERRKSEFSRLNQELNDKTSQFSQLSLKYESIFAEFNLLKEKNSKMEKEILIFTQRITELERLLKENGDRLIEYENKIAILSSELARTKKMLENRQSNSEEYARQIRELEEAKNGLVERIQEMENFINNSRSMQLYYLEVIVRLSCEVECLRVRTTAGAEKDSE